MDFTSKLKGQITQSLIECLLADAGLSVVPLGIEQVIREVKGLTKEQYLAAGISRSLRCLPDFFISNSEMTQTWLLEVKYRRHWDEKTRAELFKMMKPQVEQWQPLHLAVFLGNTSYEPTWPSSYLRMLRLVIYDGKVCHQPKFADVPTEGMLPVNPFPAEQMGWLDLDLIQKVFPGLNKQFTKFTLFKATSIVRRLAELDLFEAA